MATSSLPWQLFSPTRLRHDGTGELIDLLTAGERLNLLITRLREGPTGLQRALNAFIRDVKPEVMCECGHRAEDHYVRLAESGAYERYCHGCLCDDFTHKE